MECTKIVHNPASAYPNVDNRFICFIIEVEIMLSSLFFGGLIMDEFMIQFARKLTEQLEKFLIACKEEGDVTIDDVLKRIESLKKRDLGPGA